MTCYVIPIRQSSGIEWEQQGQVAGRAYAEEEQVLPSFESKFVQSGRSQQFLHQYQKVLAERFAARQLELIRRQYILEDGQSVEGLLESHPSLGSLLLEAVPLMKKYFGGDALVVLRIHTDETGSQTLQSVVKWRGPLRAATAALERFDDSWWLENCHRGFGNVIFDYELT